MWYTAGNKNNSEVYVSHHTSNHAVDDFDESSASIENIKCSFMNRHNSRRLNFPEWNGRTVENLLRTVYDKLVTDWQLLMNTVMTSRWYFLLLHDCVNFSVTTMAALNFGCTTLSDDISAIVFIYSVYTRSTTFFYIYVSDESVAIIKRFLEVSHCWKKGFRHIHCPELFQGLR